MKMKKMALALAGCSLLAVLAACDSSAGAKNGDTVDIYFEGYLDGVQFPGGTGNFELKLGSGQFVPGFEEQLVGAKKGETREVKLRFPDEYVPGLAGKEVVFRVTVNGIK